MVWGGLCGLCWGAVHWLTGAPHPHLHANAQLPDDPAELQRLLEKREEELKRAKLRVAAKDHEVATKAAEVRERDERVGKMEAQLETAELKLAISNTELLRYKRTYALHACTCVDGLALPPHGHSRPWPHLSHPAMSMRLPSLHTCNYRPADHPLRG